MVVCRVIDTGDEFVYPRRVDVCGSTSYPVVDVGFVAVHIDFFRLRDEKVDRVGDRTTPTRTRLPNRYVGAFADMFEEGFAGDRIAAHSGNRSSLFNSLRSSETQHSNEQPSQLTLNDS